MNSETQHIIIEDRVQSIEQALALAEIDYEKWGSVNKQMLRHLQMSYLRLYLVTQLFHAHHSNDPDAILNLILKINQEIL